MKSYVRCTNSGCQMIFEAPESCCPKCGSDVVTAALPDMADFAVDVHNDTCYRRMCAAHSALLALGITPGDKVLGCKVKRSLGR